VRVFVADSADRRRRVEGGVACPRSKIPCRLRPQLHAQRAPGRPSGCCCRAPADTGEPYRPHPVMRESAGGARPSSLLVNSSAKAPSSLQKHDEVEAQRRQACIRRATVKEWRGGVRCRNRRIGSVPYFPRSHEAELMPRNGMWCRRVVRRPPRDAGSRFCAKT